MHRRAYYIVSTAGDEMHFIIHIYPLSIFCVIVLYKYVAYVSCPAQIAPSRIVVMDFVRSFGAVPRDATY